MSNVIPIHPTDADGEIPAPPPNKYDIIGRIDQVRGIIALTSKALIEDNEGRYGADAACALDLANEVPAMGS